MKRSLIKHRPRLRLLMPAQVIPGVPFEATVIVEASREVELESIQIVIDGEERARTGSDQYSTRNKVTLCRVVGRAAGKVRVQPGSSRYSCSLVLPSTIPPSYIARNV